MTILLIYVAIFAAAMTGYSLVRGLFTRKHDFTSLKTVTFGDESAVSSNRVASIISVLSIFLIWCSFTGSTLVPGFLHVPGPFVGKASIAYQATAPDGSTDDGIILVDVHQASEAADLAPLDAAADVGFARDRSLDMVAWRSTLISRNDLLPDAPEAVITSVDGRPVTPNGEIEIPSGLVRMTDKGSLAFEPAKGWQMEPIWLPAPETVVARFIEISKNGYQNVTLWENLSWSLYRVLVGFFLGSIVGVPLGYAMGLNSWFRGWFDPIVEFMRPVPPLALIPLIIIWFGIWETGKISLLFLAALWIMVIAARSGVSGVRITKVHAAYSLGASKWQLLTRVIVPNSLPEIFTGARVAMGVCWGTVVAAELVAAEKGAGKMIIAASKFQNTDIVIMGIILIGIIGYSIDILMRMAEKWLIPWKGKA
ncbi:taurine transport system permease protein [Hoeflea marina]|uniref:Taurine transport system permease protein n=1 Tax=Hoeflea marina TaxID=274592 RepID=A0A317PH71_9HYPH|nr:ABC transporter permease subunit [Hoeflea marina]PWV99978.1 taurine transport system permease protein [Hoeflea marina]